MVSELNTVSIIINVGSSTWKITLYVLLQNEVESDGNKQTIIRIFENRVEVWMQKEKAAWWPRLTAQPQKPAWLKVIGPL